MTDNLMNQIDAQMQRLGWTVDQGREHLQKYYGVRSRLLMISTSPSQQGMTVLNADYQHTELKNRFQSFEEFKEFIETNFIQGSGIESELFKHCIEFHEDQEFDYGGEVTTPIHEALNWTFTRFTQQIREPMYAAFLMNEDGTVWQAVLSQWDEKSQRPYIYRPHKQRRSCASPPGSPFDQKENCQSLWSRR
ncbi:hypothetical protein [Nostoc sp.]|uniref:hypothetical protein n=1 Tax=Nostoc sp. TaxID=1180 RepID=UPI002FF90060